MWADLSCRTDRDFRALLPRNKERSLCDSCITRDSHLSLTPAPRLRSVGINRSTPTASPVLTLRNWPIFRLSSPQKLVCSAALVPPVYACLPAQGWWAKCQQRLEGWRGGGGRGNREWSIWRHGTVPRGGSNRIHSIRHACKKRVRRKTQHPEEKHGKCSYRSSLWRCSLHISDINYSPVAFLCMGHP